MCSKKKSEVVYFTFSSTHLSNRLSFLGLTWFHKNSLLMSECVLNLNKMYQAIHVVLQVFLNFVSFILIALTNNTSSCKLNYEKSFHYSKLQILIFNWIKIMKRQSLLYYYCQSSLVKKNYLYIIQYPQIIKIIHNSLSELKTISFYLNKWNSLNKRKISLIVALSVNYVLIQIGNKNCKMLVFYPQIINK